jgi:hypothetical protein
MNYILVSPKKVPCQQTEELFAGHAPHFSKLKKKKQKQKQNKYTTDFFTNVFNKASLSLMKPF